MAEIQIMPSILAAPMGRLEEACQLCEKAGADQLHMDVMDGHFVPNLSMGPDIVRMASEAVKIPMNVHLMCSRPDTLMDHFIKAGSDTILIHIESDCDVPAELTRIRNAGIKAGITINPDTDVDAIGGLIKDKLVDEALVMSVYPGFGGQSFIDSTLPKIAAIRALDAEICISVDGGVTDETAVPCVERGANLLVMGTYLFKQTDMQAEVSRLHNLLRGLA